MSTKWEREVSVNGGRTKDFHRFFCCCAERLGNMFVFCKRRDGSPIIIAGPCWPFCCFVTVPLILGASGAVSYWLIIRENSALVRQNCIEAFQTQRKSIFSKGFVYLVVAAIVGIVHLLSRAWICLGSAILCRLSGSRLDGTHYGWRSRGGRLVLEWTSWEFSTTGGTVLQGMWGAHNRLC